jgi:hypothetical protein
MKNMQINLENYGGHDVEFPISKNEFEMRVKQEVRYLSDDPIGFGKKLKNSMECVNKYLPKFYSSECCEGPEWDIFKAALIDEICKLKAKNNIAKEVFVL